MEVTLQELTTSISTYRVVVEHKEKTYEFILVSKEDSMSGMETATATCISDYSDLTDDEHDEMVSFVLEET